VAGTPGTWAKAGGGGLNPLTISGTPASGDHIGSQFFNGNTSKNTTLNVIYFTPIYLPAMTIAALSARVGTTVAAGAVLRLGLFLADAARGLPGTLVVDAGTMAATSATFYADVAITNTAVAAGLYWGAVCNQGVAASVFAYNSQGVLVGNPLSPDSTDIITPGQNQWTANGVSGAFASNPTLTYNGNTSVTYPLFGVQAA
jgi:hypothetical protein